MLRKTSTLAVLAVMTSATFAVAEEHTILFLGDAFFPEVSYIHPGDTIRFVNASAEELNVMGAGEAWTVGPIAINGEATINVTGNMEMKYFDADSADEEGSLSVAGDLSFDPAPEG